MKIRPGSKAEQEVVYTAGSFDESGAFVTKETGGEFPFGGLLCCHNSPYSIETAPSGQSCSYLDHQPLTSPDGSGKAWYIKDLESGDIWSPFPFPTNQSVDEYEVRCSPGQISIHSLKNKIACTFTIAVVPELSCEVWLVKFANLSAQDRILTFTTYAEPCTGQTFEARRFDNGKVMLLRQPLEVLDHPVPEEADTDLVVFQTSTLAPVRYQIEKSMFVGENGSFAKPRQVASEEAEPCEDLAGQAISSMTVQIELPIEGEAEFGFAFGAAPGAERAFEIACRFTNIKPVIDAVRKSSWLWKNLCSNTQVKTPDPALNALINTWLPYEAYAEWVGERNGSSYVSPERIADCLRAAYPFTATAPNTVRKAIADFASSMSVIGAYYVSDDLAITIPPDEQLWLALCTASYVIESGDIGILNESVILRDGPRLTIREHCERAIRMSIHSGKRQTELTEQVIRLWNAVSGEDCEFGVYVCDRNDNGEDNATTKQNTSARMRYLQSICPTLANSGTNVNWNKHDMSCQLYSSLIEQLLGLTALPEGLMLDPEIPRMWEECEITRKLRGGSFQIKVVRAEGLIKDRPSMLVDGEPVDGNLVSLSANGSSHNIELMKNF